MAPKKAALMYSEIKSKTLLQLYHYLVVKKVVILDEADYLNPQSTQPALRGFVEEFHKNCRFILTCNFKNRIIEPLHSRFSNIEFRISPKDKGKLATKLFERVTYHS